MGKRIRAAIAGLKPKRITSKQRRARQVNIKIARLAKQGNAKNSAWLKGNKSAKTVMIDEVKAFYK